jgi:hypothetical protein
MDAALIDRTSEQFLGQWKRLVSTTNWQKGEIIFGWREALRATGAPTAEWSDDAWSRRVGHVTPQHVGRLRRVYERFAAAHDDYPGLFWSHFQIALDWDDAEMWLEGAVQNGWSISQMRDKRWETLGAVAGDAPHDDADHSMPWDEDADASPDVVSGALGVVHAPEGDGSYNDEPAESRFDVHAGEDDWRDDEGESVSAAKPARAEVVRPFASLPPLPPDISDAFEAYKLCILRHKLAGWREVSRDDLLASLEALKQLALAPA